MDIGELLHLGVGVALVAAGWLLPRGIAGARRSALAALLLDVAPFVLGAGLLILASGRPVFAGVIVLTLGAGFTLADYTMRRTLREPVVFSESVELPQVFTHPHLYLPFAGPGLVLGGATAAAALALALLVVEPPLWTPRLGAALAADAAIVALAWLAARQPLLGVLGNLARGLKPTGEPFADAAVLGPFAMLLVHMTIARAERGARRRALAAPAVLREDLAAADPVPIILVQCESFFDARRLSPLVPSEFLAGYDACCASAARFGRLTVPGWGANTMRAEFAVLSGIPEEALGYDRFNPYYAFARVPIESQVWRLRRAAYRTVCLHPFDGRFFRRDLAMPALGFERFLDRRTLGGRRVPPYHPDTELAGQILRTLDESGPRSFIFAITMANHGPWLPHGPPLDPLVAGLFGDAEIPGAGELLRYLDGLRRSDEMLRLLMAGLAERGGPAVLAFYGDHLPSLGSAFQHFGFDEPHSDYAIWTHGIDAGPSTRHDLPAHDLGRLIVDAVLGVGPESWSRVAAAPPSPDLAARRAARQPAGLVK